MPVWLVLSLGISAAAVFVKLITRRYRIVHYCPEEHQMGPVILIHQAEVPCEMSLWVARHAQEIWEKLRDDFPEETQEALCLDVIWNPHAGPGWQPWNESRAVINMAEPALLDVVHNDFEARQKIMRGTIAEELHHIVRFRRFGEERYQFRADPEDGHLGAVLHYAVNEFETEALRFCVRTTGDRADLLREVEEYLAGQKKIEFRGLATNA
uniref:Uncharacterized protein n=1 Tax=candidate division WWE3 bacterium TaxID=2053526 RepID=A0A831YYX5_UNCKA